MTIKPHVVKRPPDTDVRIDMLELGRAALEKAATRLADVLESGDLTQAEQTILTKIECDLVDLTIKLAKRMRELA